MALLSQSRALAGAKAMRVVQSRPAVVANGSRWFMRRRDSFMVEVNVTETETEDQAVKRYMKAVVQSGVLNKLRARRTKETKIEAKKRKMAEKAQARKLGIEEPTWEEFYGENLEEAKPFDEFFCKPGDEEEALALAAMEGQLPTLDGGGDYYAGEMYDLSQYSEQQAANPFLEQGGYLNQPPQQQGGYAPPPPQQPPLQQPYDQQQPPPQQAGSW